MRQRLSHLSDTLREKCPRTHKIIDKSISIIGGSVTDYEETLLDLETGDYITQTYQHVEHGVWKLKFKLKK